MKNFKYFLKNKLKTFIFAFFCIGFLWSFVSISYAAGYTSVGWGDTNGATTGTSAGSSYSVSTNNKSLYANAVRNKLTGGSVKITGPNTYGSTLMANVTPPSPTPDSYTYQWYYTDTPGATTGGTAISGATSSTYTIGSGMVGKYIYVVVGAIKENYDGITLVDATDTTNNTTQAVAKQNLSVSTTNYSASYDANTHYATVKVTSPIWREYKLWTKCNNCWSSKQFI